MRIDDDLTAKERDYVILHELHERYLMSTGFDYAKAHASSSAIEYRCRRDPDLLKSYIAKELIRNQKI